MSDLAVLLRALANEKRLKVLDWLKRPAAHFRPHVYGDRVKDGICLLFIAKKLRVSPPTAAEHMRILARAGFVRAKRIRQWTFYKRDEKRIAEVKRALARSI